MTQLADIQRIYPEAKSALINWIEVNFQDIDSYVFTCVLSDGTTMTVHDVDTHLQALGLIETAKHAMNTAVEDGQFNCRK